MAILTQCHDKVSQDMQIQCSAMKKPRIGMMGTKCVFLTTTWDWKKLSFDLNLMQKKGNCQTCKHCISLAFIYFYYPKWDILQQYSSIVVQFSQNETFFKGFHPLCAHQMPSIDSSFWPPKMRLFEGFSSTGLTWNEKKEEFREFSTTVVLKWDIFRGFPPTVKPKQPKEALYNYKGQNSNFEWVTATAVNTFGIGIWTAQLFVYILLFVYIWVSCLFTFQFLAHSSALGVLFT